MMEEKTSCTTTKNTQELPKTFPWIPRDCDFCKRTMQVRRLRARVDDRTGHHYIRTEYLCLDCDVKMTTVVPRKIAATIAGEASLPPIQETQNLNV